MSANPPAVDKITNQRLTDQPEVNVILCPCGNLLKPRFKLCNDCVGKYIMLQKRQCDLCKYICCKTCEKTVVGIYTKNKFCSCNKCSCNTSVAALPIKNDCECIPCSLVKSYDTGYTDYEKYFCCGVKINFNQDFISETHDYMYMKGSLKAWNDMRITED